MDAPPDFRALADELCRRLADDDWERWTEAELERWAVEAFALQFRSCGPYRAFCERRGVTPESVASWTDVPALPATAFKYFDFASADAAAPASPDASAFRDARVFRTSGTTRGSERRGRHHVPRPDLYRASLAEPFRRALLPEVGRGSGASAALFISLIPSPADAPDSSLSFMVGAAAERFAATTHWLVDGSGGWRTGALDEVRASIEDAAGRDAPVLLLGTALAFVHLLDGPGRDGGAPGQAGSAPGQAGGAPGQARRAPAANGGAAEVAEALSDLPEGARAMETGGFKGTRRRVSRSRLHRGIAELTGIPRSRIVNEYGMTELLSQLYEPVLDEGVAARGLHAPPPWLRVRALHPGTLDPVPEGEEGILAFFDLANLGSVCHVLTEDVGSVEDGRVRFRGRAEGAEPRGCSRAMDDLMSAAAGRASEGR